MNFDARCVPFKRGIGIEKTFCSPRIKDVGVFRDNNDTRQNNLDDGLAYVFGSLYAKKGVNVYKDIYADPGCVEVPSPILKSYDEIKKFWNYWVPKAEAWGMTHTTDEHTGGAGHIHIDAPLYTQYKVLRDIASRPYLSWTFIHPSDDINAKTIAKFVIDEGMMRSGITRLWLTKIMDEAEYYANNRASYTWNNTAGMYDKYYVVRMTKEEGLEFRGFSSAESLQEQYEHVAFVQAYVEYCAKNPVATIPFTSKTEAKSYLRKWNDYEKCEIAFLDLVLELGLDPETYIKYPQRYMKERFEFELGALV